MYQINKHEELVDGLKKGIPIGVGYLAVSFTFGITAAMDLGIPVWQVILISLTNLTSSGQFAGVNLIYANATFFEIGLSVLVINLRYALMSLSLSQKIEKDTRRSQKLIFGFGVTDEVFALASTRERKLTAHYMYGLMTVPIIGWTLGTALGAIVGGILPDNIADAMGIALYAMFIAVIVPPAKKSVKILGAIMISVLVTCIIKYVPVFSFITGGFTMIIATVAASAIMAIVAPVEDKEEEKQHE